MISDSDFGIHTTWLWRHMSVMASQIATNKIACLTACSD